MTDAKAESSFSGGDEERPTYPTDDPAALAAKLDSLSRGAGDPWGLLGSLTTARTTAGVVAEPTELIAMCERALAYSFTDDQARYGALNLGQRFSSAAGDWPPAFDVVDPREKECWAELADRSTHPLPKAHFTDLVLASGHRGGLAIAERVVTSYMELGAMVTLDPYYRASCLRRAWTLARQFSLPRESDLRAAMYEMGRSVCTMADVPAGVLFRPVEPLAVAPRTGPFTHPSKEEVASLLETIETRHGSSAPVFEGIYEAREQLAETPAELELARRSLVEGYLRLAETTDGLRRLTWLQQAAREAQRLGLADLRGTAVQAMQDMTVNDLGMQSVSTEFRLPRHALDARLSRYRRSRSALEALEIWLTTPAPTGSYESNRRHAAGTGQRGILQLVSRTTISPDGMPLRSSSGPESAIDEELERLESFTAATYGIALAHELQAIKTEYAVPSSGEMGTHLATAFRCDVEKASALGAAFESYWQERYSDSARSAYPLVEAGARGLLLALGEPLFRIETGNSEGHFPALEAYAERLERLEFDIDWIRTIRNPVARLRNSMAHGQKLRATDVDAAILLRTAGLLVVLCPPDSSTADRSEIPPRLRDPLAYVAKKVKLRKRWRRVWTVSANE